MINHKSHPPGLMMLFFTEMWERFCFYGMRALLTLYMIQELFKDIDDPQRKAKALGIYAAYGSLVYATPLIGGYIADKFIGQKRAVIFGAILMAFGEFLMVIKIENWFFLALSFLIIGNGFFKPNISTMVGNLYERDDPRRDGGFTIFYMGINLGAFLSPLLCGWIGETYGWHYGFMLAGGGMLLGLFIFTNGKKILMTIGDVPSVEILKRKLFFFINREHLVYIGAILSAVLVSFLLRNYEIISYILTPFSIIVIAGILVMALRSEKQERDRLIVVLIFLFFTVLFWAFFEQAGASLTLFTNENVDRNMFGKLLPTSVFQAVNPLFIVLLGPLFSAMWLQMAVRKREPSTPFKFALGMLQLGLGFLVFAAGAWFISIKPDSLGRTQVLVPLMFLVLGYLLHTMGELCLSPIGLSMVTKLSPPRVSGMIMGAWFLSSAMAFNMVGTISRLAVTEQGLDVAAGMKLEYRNLIKTDSVLNTQTKHILVEAKIDSLSDLFRSTIDISLYKNTSENLQKIQVQSNIQFANWLIQKGIYSDSLKSKSVAHSIINSGVKLLEEKNQLDAAYIIEAGISDDSQMKNTSNAAIRSFKNLSTYVNIFKIIGFVAIAASLLMFLLVPLLKKMMHGVH